MKYICLVSAFVAALGLSACDKTSLGAPSVLDSGSHLFLTSGYLTLRKVDYGVDDTLNLNIIRNVRLDVDLGVWDNSNPQSRVTPLDSDRYTFRYALIRNGYEDTREAYQVITAGEKSVDVAGGHLVVDFPLKVKDPRLLGSRNHLLIEVAPTAPSFWKPKVYEASLDNNIANPRLAFAPFDLSIIGKPDVRDLTDLIALSNRQDLEEEAYQRALKAHYAQIQNLIEWPENEELFPGLSRQKLISSIETHQVDFSAYNSLCDMWRDQVIPGLLKGMFHISAEAADNDDFSQFCTSSREHGVTDSGYMKGFFSRLGFRYEPFFVFQNVYLVDRAKFGTILPDSRTLSLSVGNRFYVRSRIEYNHEAGFTPLSLIPILGPYLSLAGNLSVDVGMKEDSGNMLRFNTNMALEAEDSSMSLDFSQYRRCLIVRMNPAKIDDYRIKWFISYVKGDIQKDQMRRALSERGLLVCGAQETKPVAKKERYYYIYPAKQNGWQQDPTDIRNRSFALPLRGQRDFYAFMKAGESKLENEDPESTNSDYAPAWVDGVQEVLTSVTPGSPGVYFDSLFY